MEKNNFLFINPSLCTMIKQPFFVKVNVIFVQLYFKLTCNICTVIIQVEHSFNSFSIHGNGSTMGWFVLVSAHWFSHIPFQTGNTHTPLMMICVYGCGMCVQCIMPIWFKDLVAQLLLSYPAINIYNTYIYL